MLWGVIAGISACTTLSRQDASQGKDRYDFGNILNIAITPDSTVRRVGCFTDAGSWMGFTIPQRDKWINGFCGPFSIDNRIWFAQSAVEASITGATTTMVADSTSYFPGEVYMSASSDAGTICQRLNFINASTALLQVESNSDKGLSFTARQWNNNVYLEADRNKVTARHANGEIITITFDSDVTLTCNGQNYIAKTAPGCKQTDIAISFFASEKELPASEQRIRALLNNPSQDLKANAERWNGYLSKILRNDMKPEYDRIAVKSAVTLISNWRTHRGGLLHEGVIPSHAVSYFIGFWAWDSWRFSAALASFAPELAKTISGLCSTISCPTV